MRLAILGATSQIAKDFIRIALGTNVFELFLYARNPGELHRWVGSTDKSDGCVIDGFVGFNYQQKYDAVINFVGSGNPAKTALIGPSILDVTYQYDELALSYVRKHPNTRYIFLSSGAAYGSDFSEPASEASISTFHINGLRPTDWYGVAKFYAECRHRSLSELSIVDLRVFNYFSRSQDLRARFLISDILRAVKDQTLLQTSEVEVVRDYLHPNDFYAMVKMVLSMEPTNIVFDCFSRSPIGKAALLSAMSREFGLQYEYQSSAGVNATGHKPNYFTVNHRAREFGYAPSMGSLETILSESAVILNPRQFG